MDADGNSEEPSLLVLVRFKTDLGHPYKVPESSISIPASLTRFGLSPVVNNLITSVNPYWESEPFDFLIKNELVRMWLEKFLLAKNISANFPNGSPLPITSTLEGNLDEKSRLYKDPSLHHVFLMNNLWYMAQKVKGDELRPIFGDGWLWKCNGKVQQQALPEI
ncbi:hypothetical protein C1H46_039547 [Malus baccata]|uniref:Exocyst subunit Exo70 family protein n=1 Tax=Malus baccata TaxID=106549 RepID=A0A540KL34_MALBA|nr:hypothetical protein C1H46_039547 [Malus baccata]